MGKEQVKKRTAEVIKRLAREYPNAECHLEFKSPFELLVSTVLAAQTTDVRVNLVMTPLYKSKYRLPEDILRDGIDSFRENIKSINFFNNKSKSVLGICEKLIKEYKGKVPDTMDKLTELPGVGRKSASVLLGNCYGKNDVIIVDTHLKRVASRLGLIVNEDPEKIEFELKGIVPDSEQFNFSMRIGEHGRLVCKAKKPECSGCFLSDLCPSYNKV